MTNDTILHNQVRAVMLYSVIKERSWALCYLNRLIDMNYNKLTKQVYSSLVQLSYQEFNTWATDALKLVNGLGYWVLLIKDKW